AQELARELATGQVAVLELEIDPVAEPVLAIGQAAVQAPVIVRVAERALETVPAGGAGRGNARVGVPAPGIVPAAAERGHEPAGEVPEPVQVAVRPRTKSATAAHRRDQVRHRRDQVRHLAAEDPAAEDLAAAVGITREPAATEGAAAWVVAE